MNLLRHDIKEIHSVEDITDAFTKHAGYTPDESFLSVDMTYDCYGMVVREKQSFWESDFKKAKEAGYFLK